MFLESVASGTTTLYIYVLFFPVSAHVEGPPLIGITSRLHCNEQDDYTNMHYVVECIRVGVSDRGVLNQLVNLNCVPLVPDGDAKRQGLYWFRQSMPYVQSERSILYSLHRSASSRGLQAL